ncbi:MAG: hypothetical protein U0798_19315 [Gemmataceae bacterium]
MLSARLKLRLAGHLQRSWPRKLPPDPDSRDWWQLERLVEKLHSSRRRWKLAQDRRLSLTLPTLYQEIISTLDDLDRSFNRIRVPLDEATDEFNPSPGDYSLHHWLAELHQLEEEFDDLRVNWKAKTISVTTDPITLQEIHLGRFSIVFGWNRVGTLSGSRCFDLIALDPNPAQNKDRVTHPHVQEEELCAGEASHPLENAINEGRLADAFLMIRSVLMTYNAGSPYVPLEEWESRSCGECGDSIDLDESRSCETCLGELCTNCAGSCCQCSDTRCPNCLSSCETCQESCCPGCLETIQRKALCSSCIGRCAECHSRFPKEDLSADSLCPDCLESQESNDDSDPLESDISADSSLETLPVDVTFC